MQSKARFLGHSVHQMLIVFPLGLLATAVMFDIAFLVTDRPEMAAVSYWMMAAGLIGALVAAPFGLVDWLAIEKNTRAKRIGALHGGGNAVVTLLFAASWLLRGGNPSDPPGIMAILLGLVGALIALFTAWLGGELVARLGVGVYDDANVNASNSITHRHHEAQARQVH
ncbi:DUF2231 domain-containing protein [Piscinibacter sp. XHJ-5]|uniref:DUF2231 domain-containing protein n=1 Tax=Piscinibacter sp. XHJ-5 TaxID=3037797 RepID=UPI002452AEBA|nr:DUF2231 domain-containing protein [Piscinibacter sp. XHJ-5]